MLRIGALKVNRTFLPALSTSKTVSIDPDHLRRVTLTVVPQRIAMVMVHVLNDLQFLRRRKWIFRHKSVSFYPEDLPKSGNESNPHDFQPEKREIMSLVILPRGWKVPEVSIWNVHFVAADRPSVGDARDAGLRLHVIRIATVLNDGK